jgi:RNA polymerase-binding transcription factor DksA
MPGMETLEATARATLEAERESLRSQLEKLGRGGAGLPTDHGHADSSLVAAEEGEYRALAANLESLLGDVERALQKLDDGTYGTCETCGAAIAPARLEAMPASRFCVDHA